MSFSYCCCCFVLLLMCFPPTLSNVSIRHWSEEIMAKTTSILSPDVKKTSADARPSGSEQQHKGDGQFLRKMKPLTAMEYQDSIICKHNQSNPEEMVCESPPIQLAIVVPISTADFDLASSNMLSWTSPDYFPCNPNRQDSPRVDLVLVTGRESFLSHVRTHFGALIDGPLREAKEKCFANVQFLSSGLTEEEDTTIIGPDQVRYRQNGKVLTFVRLLGAKGFENKYSHMFWMEPDTRPIRSHWVEKLEEDTALGGDFWVKGSISGIDGDHELPTCKRHRVNLERWGRAALYRTNSKQFKDFLKMAQWQRPDSIEAAIFEYLMRCDLYSQNQVLLHLFHFSDLVDHDPQWPKFTLSQVLNRQPETYFLSGGDSVSVLTGVAPCGTKGNMFYPVPSIHPNACLRWNSNAVLTIQQIDEIVVSMQKLPSSPWGTDIALSALHVWEENLLHASHDRKHDLRMRVEEYRHQWCVRSKLINCQGIVEEENKQQCWLSCFHAAEPAFIQKLLSWEWWQSE